MSIAELIPQIKVIANNVIDTEHGRTVERNHL